MKLYKYSGTIEELAVERGRISYIKLFDVTDFDKAPTRLEVFGALGKYIEAIEGTDAEERYIKSRVIGTLTATCICAALRFPAVRLAARRKSSPRARTTSTSWRSSASRTISRPASRNPCPARKFTAGPIGNART